VIERLSAGGHVLVPGSKAPTPESHSTRDSRRPKAIPANQSVGAARSHIVSGDCAMGTAFIPCAPAKSSVAARIAHPHANARARVGASIER
jgi:hypothetical protein